MGKYQLIINTLSKYTDFELELLIDGLIVRANNLQEIPNYQGMKEWAYVIQVIKILSLELSDREELYNDYLHY